MVFMSAVRKAQTVDLPLSGCHMTPKYMILKIKYRNETKCTPYYLTKITV